MLDLFSTGGKYYELLVLAYLLEICEIAVTPAPCLYLDGMAFNWPGTTFLPTWCDWGGSIAYGLFIIRFYCYL